MDRPCAYCESTQTEWIEVDALWHCHACGHSYLAEAEAETRSPSADPQPNPAARRASQRSGHGRVRGAPGDAGSLPAAALALALTILFYLLIQLFPDSMLFELFTRRGWVPYVITAISSWALCLLASKLRQLRRESAVLQLELVLTPLPGRLRPDDAGTVLAQLASLPAPAVQSFLAVRLTRALQHFEARRRVVEVVEHLASESRADDLRVDASYSLVRVFVWAVPTLGFIGTVIGIGAAVGSFSDTLEAASSLESMKESIGSVTSGLGVAFDTTLLALVMSMLIMFPANAVQRMEETLLGRVDDYCTEHLVQRLEDEQDSSLEPALIEALAARLVRAMHVPERS